MKHRVFGITGWKNNGKTTLTARLVEKLTQRGYRLASVKHAHHDFDIDHEGTDSWRHRKAGAREIAIVSARRWAMIHELEQEREPRLAEILEKLAPCDLVVVEGYKHDNHDKLEVRRQGGKTDEHLSNSDSHVVAIASDMPQDESGLPVFHLDDIAAIADFVERHMQLQRKRD